MKTIALLLLLCVQLPAVAQSDALPDTGTTVIFSPVFSHFNPLASVETKPTIYIRADSGEHWRQNHWLEVRLLFAGMGQDADLVKLLLLWREYKASLGTDSTTIYTGEGVRLIAIPCRVPVRPPKFEGFMAYLEGRIIVADSAGTVK